MIKKILPLSLFILLVILIVLFGIQNLMNGSRSQGFATITPTLLQGRQGSGYTPQTPAKKPNGIMPSGTVAQISSEELQKKLPVYAADFTLSYSPRMQRYVATIATDEANNSYVDWLAQNPSYEEELQSTIVTKQTVEELHSALDYAKEKELSPVKKAQQDATIFTNTLNTLINLPFLFMQSSSAPDEVPSPTPGKQTRLPSSAPSALPTNRQSLVTSPSAKLTYYSQTGSPYGSYPLPIQNGKAGQTCTISSAGCGPTTAAMILASYVDSSQTPPKVVDSMSKAGVSISCNGSGMSELYNYMSQVKGLKVTGLISLGDISAKEAVGDFKGYLGGGWTLFVLAHHKYGGHYFWVTEVTNNGEILAYDPAYGAGKSAPINQNAYAPAPTYRYAFGVKKS